MVEESIHVKFVERRVPRDAHTFVPQMVPVAHIEEKEEMSLSDNEKEIHQIMRCSQHYLVLGDSQEITHQKIF